MSTTIPNKSFNLAGTLDLRTNFAKLKETIKKAIFGVFFILNKNFDPNIMLIVIFSSIEIIQLMSFSFYPLLYSSWNNLESIKNIYQSLNKFEIINYFNSEKLFYFLVIYLVLFVLILIIFDIIYVAYSYGRGFFSMMILVHILKYLLYTLTTVLFLPFFRLFLSVFQCTSNKKHLIVSKMDCFTGLHYLHIFLSIISMLILIFLVSLCIIFFYHSYEYITNKRKHYEILKDSKGLIFKFFLKIIVSLIFTFVDKGENKQISYTFQWVIIIFLNIISINYSFYIYFNDIYYIEPDIQLFHCTLAFIYTWTNFSLLISKFLITLYNFKGGLYILITGILLIIIVMIFNPRYDNTLEILILTKFERNYETISYKLKILLHVISYRTEKRNQTILKEYIKNHRKFCLLNNCPIEEIKQSILNDQNFHKNPNITKILINFVNRLYLYSMTKFPNSINLKIDYSNFLYFHKKQRFKALSEIEEIENNQNFRQNLSLESEFLIFKTKKIILDEQYINKDRTFEFSLNDTAIAYESHYKQCQSAILLVSKLFLDFWAMLSNTKITPDINKLNSTGEKINDCLNNINEHWNRMQHYNPNNPRALKMYSSFISQILNNREMSKEIMLLGKGINIPNYISKENENDDYENEYKDELIKGNGILIISGDYNNFGTILKCSASVGKILGFLISDIIGKNIDEFFIKGYNGYISYYLKEKYKTYGNKIKYEENYDINNEKIFYCVMRNQQINPVYIIYLGTSIVNEKSIIKVKLQEISNVNTDIYNNHDSLNKFINKAVFIIDSRLKILSLNNEGTLFLSLLKPKKKDDMSTDFIFYFPNLLKEYSKKTKGGYKITDTDLLDIKDGKLIHEFTVKIHKSKKSKNFPSAYKFNNKISKYSEYPIQVKLTVSQVDDLKEIILKKKKEEIELNKTISFEHEYFMNLTKDNISDEKNELAKEEENSDSEVDEEYESIKAQQYIINIEYSISHLIKFKIDQLNNQSHQRKFEERNIDSPFLSINIDKVLDEIEDKRKKDEKEKENDNSSVNVSMTNISKNLNNTKVSNENFGPSNSRIKKRNIMSYLKSKGKFVKLYDFEGLDFMKDIIKNETLNEKTLQEIKEMNLENIYKEKKPKLIGEEEKTKINLPSIKEIHNNISQDNKNTLNEINLKFNQSKNTSLLKSDTIESNENNNNSGIEILDSKALLIIQSDLNLRIFKEHLDLLPNYGKNIQYKVFQNNKFISLPNQNTQLSLFLQIQEATIQGDTMKLKQLRNPSSEKLNKFFSTKKYNDNDEKKKHIKIIDEKIDNDPHTKKRQRDKKKTLQSLIRLKVFSFISFIILLSIIITIFLFSSSANSKTKNSVNLVSYSYDAMNQISFGCYILRNLLLIQEKNYTEYLYSNSYEEFRTLNLDYLTNIQINLDYIINNITESSLKLKDEHNQLINHPTIYEFFLDSNGFIQSKENRTLIQLLREMRIYILTFANFPDISLNNNTLVNDLFYNCFNDFLRALKSSSSLYTDLVFHNNKYHKILFSLLFSCAIFISILESFIISKIFIEVDYDKTKILCAFYEIPHEYINDLSKMCMKFIEKNEKEINMEFQKEGSNVDFNDEINDDDEEELLDNKTELVDTYCNSSHSSTVQKRIIEIKNSNKKQNKYKIIKVGSIYIIFMIIFIIDFVFKYQLYSKMDKIIDSYNYTARAESQYISSLNFQREKIINESAMILESKDLLKLNETLETNFNLNGNILLKLINTNHYFSKNFLDFFNEIANGNICKYLNLEKCEERQSGIGNYGIEVISIKFFDYLRLGIIQYIKSTTNKNAIEILSGRIIRKSCKILQYFIKPIYNILTTTMEDEIIKIINSQFNLATILFSVFIVVVIIIYIIVWIPILKGLDDEIIRTKKMLNIIPIQILDKIDSLKTEKD